MVAEIRKAEEATADYDAMTLTIAVAYGGREEIADAVRDLIRAKVRDGLGLDELAEHITPAAIDQISTPPASEIPTSSSAPAARCGYRAFCYGKALIANSTLRMSIGRSSAKSTSCARFARSNRGRDALAVTYMAEKYFEARSKECNAYGEPPAQRRSRAHGAS